MTNSRCAGTWKTPSDNWLYGEDNFLYKDAGNNYTLKEAKNAVKTRIQTLSNRYQYQANADTVGYYSYSGDNKGNMEIQILCTVEAERNQGYGLKMMNDAIRNHRVKLSEHAQSVTVSPIAHDKAIGFYNNLNMDCTVKSQEELVQQVYQKRLLRQPPESLQEKYRCLYSELSNSASPRKIDSSKKCLTHDMCNSFLSLNTNLEDLDFLAAVHQQCDQYAPDKIPFNVAE